MLRSVVPGYLGKKDLSTVRNLAGYLCVAGLQTWPLEQWVAPCWRRSRGNIFFNPPSGILLNLSLGGYTP